MVDIESVQTLKKTTGAAEKKNRRNSSFELLRILSMIMILSFHLISQQEYVLKSLPFSIKQVILLFFSCTGAIGVVVFFGISAWFLCMSDLTGTTFVKSSLKRIWLLEREVLFYSFLLLAAFLVYDRSMVTFGLIRLTFMPSTRGMWWYVTSYVVFLLLYPFLTVGLHKIGKRMHGALCLCLIATCGLIYGLLPFWVLNFVPYSFMGFIYLYVLISYYRWYMKELTAKTGWLLIVVGLFMLFASILILAFLYASTGRSWFLDHELYLDDQFKLPVVLVGFGLLLIASHANFVSTPINFIAKTTFGVYLIHQHPLSMQLLQRLSLVEHVYDSHFAIFYVIGVLLAVFAFCSLIDMLRIFVFRFTVDRHPGRLFDKLTAWISDRTVITRIHTMLNSLNRV